MLYFLTYIYVRILYIYLAFDILGHDIMTIKKGLNGITTAYNMTRIKLTPGVIHYSNVIAYNYAGSHTTTSSDGFVVDHKAPMAGVVYDGLGQYLVHCFYNTLFLSNIN